MDTGEVLVIAALVIVPAAILWAVFLVRTGKGGRPRALLGIPQALRPAPPDDVLEGRRLERVQAAGVLSLVAIGIFIVAYWLPESDRQGHFSERFEEESVERGSLIVNAPPELPEDADPQAFKAAEKELSLGMGCALCHGGVVEDDPATEEDESATSLGGALVDWTDPTTGKRVKYNGPPLQTVFQRWDEEIVRFTIERGRPGTPMPAWGVEYGGPMTSQMVDDVIAYLQSLPGNNQPPEGISEGCRDPQGTNLRSCGQEIFEARCAVCHGDRGQGKEASGTTDDPWYQGLPLWKGDARHLSKALHQFTIEGGRRFGFMPPFSETPPQGIPVPPYPLTESQIKAVIKYERNL